jgi:small subunit ribosomal protein S4
MMRRFGEAMFRSRKYETILERRSNPPGQHGPKARRGKKKSEYGKRLEEKQKLRFIYNVTEKQMRRYVAKAFRSKGINGHVLLQLLETRLDNMVYRIGFANTIWSARQLVSHGHVRVNGKKVDVPSYEVRVGDEVSLAEGKMRENGQVQESLKNAPIGLIPPFLESDRDQYKAKLIAVPKREDIKVEIEEQLIVEYYSKFI